MIFLNKLAESNINVLYDVDNGQPAIDDQFGMQTVEDISENIKSGALQTYLNELPDKLIAMGVKVLLTFIIVLVGIKLIKMFRKAVSKALNKANVEKGVIQFTDSLIKTVLTILLVLWVAVNFGVVVERECAVR